MRHPYTADVGDFGKYGLLRTLQCGMGNPTLGIIWYLTDADEQNKDGKHDGYLNGAAGYRGLFQPCDPELYDLMRQIRRPGERVDLNIQMIEELAVFSSGTRYFAVPVPWFQGRAGGAQGREERWRERDAWLERALEATRGAALSFLDPDNGIRFEGHHPVRNRKPSHKHCYWHEVERVIHANENVVVYHHLGRTGGTHEEQVATCLSSISRRGHDCWAIHYRRGTGRAFVVIPASKQDSTKLRELSKEFADRWGQHCTYVEL